MEQREDRRQERPNNLSLSTVDKRVGRVRLPSDTVVIYTFQEETEKRSLPTVQRGIIKQIGVQFSLLRFAHSSTMNALPLLSFLRSARRFAFRSTINTA